MEISKVVGFIELGITIFSLILALLKMVDFPASPSDSSIFTAFMIGQIFYNFRVERALARLNFKVGRVFTRLEKIEEALTKLGARKG